MRIVACFTVLISAISQARGGRPVLPDLEPLYDSSDAEVSWPPAGTDFSGPHDTWPGQGQRFGKVWPRIKVPVVKKLSFEDFEDEYLSKSLPVVINNMYRKMTKRSKLDLSLNGLKKSGRAAVTFMSVNVTSEKRAERVTLREFAIRYENDEDVYIDDFVPKKLKTEMEIPTIMQNQPLLDNLTSSGYIHLGHTVPMPLMQEEENQVYCQISGEKEILLIREKDFPTWRDIRLITQPNGSKMAPFINIYKVDYEKSPYLKDIKKMYIARLTANHCLFVPAGWIHQHNIRLEDQSLEMRWKAITDYDSPRPTSAVLTLGDVVWPDDGGEKFVEMSRDRKRKEVAFMCHILDKYVLRDESTTLDTFVQRARSDRFVVGDLIQWNDECLEAASEMFRILDRNRDDQLDQTDLDGLQESDLDLWIGLVEDRHQDIVEIAFDMKMDGGPDGGASQDDARRLIEEERKKMLEKLEL